jgi:EmrB/QacA subfamily drug resistance transporter
VINPRARPCSEGKIRSTPAIVAVTLSDKTWALIAAILGTSTAYIDESIVNVALPAIETDLGASAAVAQWLINAYTLCLSALLLVGGAAADLFGRRRVFVLGIGLFAFASLWCGLAPSVTQLIIARAVQGVGAAMLIPSSLALIGASFDEAERGKAIGTWTGAAALAAAVAPILGGAIVDHSSWRLIFFINPVIALSAVLIGLRYLPESRNTAAPARLDWLGTVLIFAGLGCVVTALIMGPGAGFASPHVTGLIGAGAVLLVSFVWQEARDPVPLMPLALFASRTFSGVNLLTLLLYGALGGAFFFLPFDLIQVHGYSATAAGMAFLPFTVIIGALSRWSGGLLARFGARLPLVIGPAIAALGFVLLALPGMDGSYWTTFFLPMAVLGLGMAVSVAPLTTTVMNAVDKDRAGTASGINDAVATIAGLFAVAILGAVALTVFAAAIDHALALAPVAPDLRAALQRAKGSFVIEPSVSALTGADRQMAEQVIRAALAEGIRTIMLAGAGLALTGAACAAVMIEPRPARSS